MGDADAADTAAHAASIDRLNVSSDVSALKSELSAVLELYEAASKAHSDQIQASSDACRAEELEYEKMVAAVAAAVASESCSGAGPEIDQALLDVLPPSQPWETEYVPGEREDNNSVPLPLHT